MVYLELLSRIPYSHRFGLSDYYLFADIKRDLAPIKKFLETEASFEAKDKSFKQEKYRNVREVWDDY